MNEESSLPMISLIAVVAIVGIVVIGLEYQLKSMSQASKLKTSLPQTDLVGQAGEGVKSQQQQDTGHIWEVLKKQGLQGEHFTLNIHGKKSDFNKQDCTVVKDPITGEYSNNIFVPSYSDHAVKNQIIMMSGNSKGKWASTGDTTYGVRDSCTATFDGDAAELVIPPNNNGYFVVARVLGKPTDNPELTLEGSLLWVQDESGNDLLVLGLVTDNGFATPTTTLTRTKGNVKAVDITGLFEWSGSVCYFNTTNYCYDSLGVYICTNKNICCRDTSGDGTIDECVDPVIDEFGNEYCGAGYLLYAVGCHDYVKEWVFNIGDFVGYMWETFSDGNFKLANIRFYPVK